jgi:hypothetical protein
MSVNWLVNWCDVTAQHALWQNAPTPNHDDVLPALECSRIQVRDSIPPRTEYAQLKR